MNVLLINGSPNAKGCTFTALNEMATTLQKERFDTEIIHVGNRDIRGCIACGRCSETGHCVFDDLVNEVAPKLEAADGLVVGSPVYYASANGTLTNSHLRPTEQILHHFGDACCQWKILEHGARQ